MFCAHKRNNYGCTGKFCRYNIAIILMIANVFLLAHILFPHHHHFYNAACNQEQEHTACEVEIEKALPRIGAGRYDQDSAVPAKADRLLPVSPSFLADVLPFVFFQDAGIIFLFPPLMFRQEVQICYGALSLRAPPSILG